MEQPINLKEYKMQLRKKFKERRKAMSPHRKERADIRISERLRSLYSYRKAKTVLCYVSTAIEVDTSAIINNALADKKRVAVPRCITGTREMEFYFINSIDELKPRTFGVLEPDDDPEKIVTDFSDSICIVPALACDRNGGVSYALEGSVFVAGAAIKWLRDELGLIKTAGETEELALSVDDCGGVYMVPAFTGLGAPWWDPMARGVICGLTRGSSRAHIVRAALESIAYQSDELAHLMCDTSGMCMKRLKVDGGASNNDFLMRFQAGITNVAVERPSFAETTAFGAASLAALGVGLELNTDGRSSVFEPDMDDETRMKLREGWKKAVNKARESEN